MSEAKNEYYRFKHECDVNHEGIIPAVEDYVIELEQQKAEMLEALIERYKEVLKHVEYAVKENFGYAPNDEWYNRIESEYHKLTEIIERVTGKPIEEALA